MKRRYLAGSSSVQIMRVMLLLGMFIPPCLTPALPMLGVDTNLNLSGVQSNRIAQIGELVEIGIFINDVEAPASLNGFEFDLNYDALRLDNLSATSGGFLLGPVLPVENIDTGLSRDFAEVTIGLGGATGSGLLATMIFQPTDFGVAQLSLDDVILSLPLGVELLTEPNEEWVATITVIPEPTALALVALGLGGLAGLRRRQAHPSGCHPTDS